MSIQTVRWSRTDKLATFLVVMGMALTLIWITVPTALFVRQESMALVQDDLGKWYVVSVRRVPFGAKHAEWTAVYRVLGRGDGLACIDSGRVMVEPVDGDIVRYEVEPWAMPCIEQGPPLSITYSRTVLIFGVIPLRSSSFNFIVNPALAPVIPSEEIETLPYNTR